jgi:pyrophosphatase PpaX
MFKIILFDLDGTLLDTNNIIINCFKTTIKQVLNRDIETSEILELFGKDLLTQMKHFSKDHYEKLFNVYRYNYRLNKSKKNEVKLFDGVLDLLNFLKEKNYSIGIITSKGTSGAINDIKKFNIDKHTDFILAGYDVENNKPHPESIYRAQKFFRCKKEEMIMVGDSDNDILCGKNAGIKTCLVGWTMVPIKKLFVLNPDYIIQKPTDLINIVS